MANDPIPIRPPQPGTDRFDDDVDLREYVAVVWRYRVLVLAIAALAVAVAVLDVLITPKAYEATVTLTVNQSKIGDEPPTPDASTSRVLLQNRRLADRVIQEFNLARPPYNLNAETFVGQSVRVDEIDKSNLVQVHVTLRDSPDLAARVANRFAEEAVALNRDLNLQENATARDFIKVQLDKARADLDALETRLIREQQRGQLGAVKADADAMLANRKRLLGLQVDIAGERARLAAAEQELGKHQRLVSAPRRVDAAGALLDAAREADARPTADTGDVPSSTPPPSPTPPRAAAPRVVIRLDSRGQPVVRQQATKPVRPEKPASVPEPAAADQTPPAGTADATTAGLDLRGEFINPVYEVLEYQVATARTKIASLEEQEKQLRRLVGTGGAGNALAALYGRQTEMNRLQTEYDLARDAYTDLSTKYEQARIQIASRTAQLQVIDPAVPPASPVAPRPFRSVAIALTLGLIAGVLVALAVGYLSRVDLQSFGPRGPRARTGATS